MSVKAIYWCLTPLLGEWEVWGETRSSINTSTNTLLTSPGRQGSLEPVPLVRVLGQVFLPFLEGCFRRSWQLMGSALQTGGPHPCQRSQCLPGNPCPQLSEITSVHEPSASCPPVQEVLDWWWGSCPLLAFMLRS